MIKGEKQILVNSIKIGFFISFVTSLISFYFNDFSLLIGFILGYFISLINYYINVVSISFILKNKFSWAGLLVGVSFSIRFLIYVLGFLLAVKMVDIFSIYTVTIGYFVIRLTIYYLQFLKKEWDV
jgi:hypothetical protein